MTTAFRNALRSIGVVVILAVAITLSIPMLIARDAVTAKINSVRLDGQHHHGGP